VTDFIRETLEPSEEEGYSQTFVYDTDGACTVKRLWVDETPAHGVWLESVDGQRVKVPECLRKLVAKRVRDASYR
jgi:hypothetical protein